MKGGALLYAHEGFQARPTLDIDFMARRISNDAENIKGVFQKICQIACEEDGVTFDGNSIETGEIAVTKEYKGVRLSLMAHLDTVQQRNQIDYILCSPRWRSSIQSAKTRPGADWGSVHELLIANFRIKLRKVGKTTRPFRYDLNQFPYDYTMEVTNRFKGLDLIDRVPEELWTEFGDIVQEVMIKTIPKKKKCKKAKWLSEEALQIAVNRREAKGK